ncbi:MAG: PhzF family phenazine biosynthesis protein [Steroidobacteraceae bacterium]
MPIRLPQASAMVVGVELTAPERLSVGPTVTRDNAAACVGLSAHEVTDSRHPPQVISGEQPFLTMQLRLREALRRAKPHLPAHERILPAVGTDAVSGYVRAEADGQLHARMFASLDATIEDPATGSAAAATIALLTELHAERETEYRWRIEQGREMGRPSLILGRTEKKAGPVTAIHIGGQAVSVMRGVLQAE